MCPFDAVASIRGRILAGFVVVGVLNHVGGLREADFREATARINQQRVLTERAVVDLLRLRHDENEFRLRRDEAAIERHAKTASVVRGGLEALDEAANVAEKPLVAGVMRGFTAYLDRFAGLVRTERALGLDENAGLHGGLRRAVHDIEDRLKPIDDPRLTASMLTMRRHEKDFMARGKAKYPVALREEADRFLPILATAYVSDDIKDEIANKLLSYRQAFDDYVTGVDEKGVRTAALSQAFAELEPQIALLREAAADRYEAISAAGEAAVASIERLKTVGLAVVALVAVLLAWLTSRSITRPLTAIAVTLRRLAAGEDVAEVPGLGRHDEIGAMARAATTFKDAAAAKTCRAQALDGLIAGFERTSAQIVATLGSAAGEMQAAAEVLAANSGETSQQTKAVAAATTHASANMQLVAAASAEMSTSIGEIGRQLGEAMQVTTKTVGVVNDTDGKVRKLAEATKTINSIIGLIENIAEQTNLLALNATIEAARAGDAGKGFAVVAAEVKALATQTSSATSDIARQINEVQAATDESVASIHSIGQFVQEVNAAAKTSTTAVGEQDAATRNIARNIEEAAKNMNEVSDTIARVTQTSQSVGTASDQVLGAANNLTKQAETLHSGVDRFLAEVRAA